MGNFCGFEKVGYYLPVDNVIVSLNVIHCILLGYFLRFDKWLTALQIIHMEYICICINKKPNKYNNFYSFRVV